MYARNITAHNPHENRRYSRAREKRNKRGVAETADPEAKYGYHETTINGIGNGGRQSKAGDLHREHQYTIQDDAHTKAGCREFRGGLCVFESEKPALRDPNGAVSAQSYTVKKQSRRGGIRGVRVEPAAMKKRVHNLARQYHKAHACRQHNKKYGP
jgi:hypothetical protein